MDELEISGKRYISAARAAKEHKYHSDYIGQLVRGNKVVGQKVGRAWYVDADSLSEYLGKEVPPRGPVTKKAKTEPEPSRDLDREVNVGSGEKSVAEHDASSEEAESEVRDISPDLTEVETPFIMPLRKSGRSHVIAAIDDAPIKKVPKKVEPVVEPVAEVVEEEVVEEVPEVFVAEEPAEEETFIPLKITKESTRNIYAEPEDSFYKVSRKGLRYVQQSTRTHVPQKTAAVVALPATVKEKRSEGRVLTAISLVLVAGIVSLGAGVLMSYYLHSITTVTEASQTSSVMLSN